MAELNLSNLTEADIITKCVMPAILNAGWDNTTQIRQEVKLRDGKVIVRGKVAARRTVKSADIVLYHKPGIPLAQYAKQQAEIQTLRNQLRDILGAALSGKEVN